MKKSLNQKTEDIFKEIGEFGPYQLFIFTLVGITAFIPAIVGYSYSFYAATPNHRCKIPTYPNDTYEIQNEYHKELVNKYIPEPKDKSFKDKYDKCNLKIYKIDQISFLKSIKLNNNTLRDLEQSNDTFTLQKCKEWVYSKEYFDETIITEWDLVCDNSARRSLFSTLYFIGTYGVLLNGILSDKFGRQKAAYLFIIANAILNIILSILINVEMSDLNLQQILFGVIRLFCGIASNVYAVSVVIAIEVCGPSKRVTAANSIYYLFILGEFLVVFFAYFIRDYRILYITLTAIMVTFTFFFWIVPESPRWLMTKNRNSEAYQIFKKIAISNKKNLENTLELENLKNSKSVKRVDDNVVSPVSEVNEKLNDNDDENKEKPFSPIETIKVFFKSKKLIIRSSVILINWLTNTLVYYGISFNTTDLAGDPYLNFTLSVIVELLAIIASHFLLEKFGRKIPYAINMAITGVSLLLVLAVPTDLGIIVTILALIGKFAISFTYNAIYIITAEIHPTVIRNSAVSICQTFARMGAIIAPNIQLLGELYWYPIPFVVFGAFSALSAITFSIFMPETKNRKLPDTIEEFIK